MGAEELSTQHKKEAFVCTKAQSTGSAMPGFAKGLPYWFGPCEGAWLWMVCTTT